MIDNALTLLLTIACAVAVDQLTKWIDRSQPIDASDVSCNKTYRYSLMIIFTVILTIVLVSH